MKRSELRGKITKIVRMARYYPYYADQPSRDIFGYIEGTYYKVNRLFVFDLKSISLRVRNTYTGEEATANYNSYDELWNKYKELQNERKFLTSINNHAVITSWAEVVS